MKLDALSDISKRVRHVYQIKKDWLKKEKKNNLEEVSSKRNDCYTQC